MGFLFQKLVAYQESLRFGQEILSLMADASSRNGVLADQLRRAAMSISANIAEGWARRHPREKKQFYRVAMGSACECVPHLEFALCEKIITQEQFERLTQWVDRIGRLLNGLIHSVGD